MRRRKAGHGRRQPGLTPQEVFALRFKREEPSKGRSRGETGLQAWESVKAEINLTCLRDGAKVLCLEGGEHWCWFSKSESLLGSLGDGRAWGLPGRTRHCKCFSFIGKNQPAGIARKSLEKNQGEGGQGTG